MSASATESCGCGASVQVTSQWNSDVKDRLDEWRKGHRHSEPASQDNPLIVRKIAHVYHIHAHAPKDCPVLSTWPQMMKCCPVHDRHEGCPHDAETPAAATASGSTPPSGTTTPNETGDTT